MASRKITSSQERSIHHEGIKSLCSSSWGRVIVAVICLTGIGLMIEIMYLIKFEHGFVLSDEIVEKAYRIYNQEDSREMIEFKRKTIYISHDERTRSEILNMKRSNNEDQLFIVKLVESTKRNSTLTTSRHFDRTYLLKTGNIYLIRSDQSLLKEIEGEILWIKSFENELKTNLDLFYIYEAAKNSTGESKMHLEILLIPSLKDISSVEKVSETFKNNFVSFMKYHSDNYKINIAGEGLIDIQVPLRHLNKIAPFLLESPSVKWIQRKDPMRVSNKVGAKHVQGLRTDSELASDSNPIWDKNITGEGEIITVADTGLDWDNCFFSDPSIPVVAGVVNKDHRKVLAYINIKNEIGIEADGMDGFDGHGTHVCGSVAGYLDSKTNNMSYYNGVAFKSKLIVLDIENEKNSGLLIPSDIRAMFLQGYNLNSRVFSNSYTCSYAALLSCTYDCQCYLLEDDDVLGAKFSLVANEKCKSAFGLDCCRLCNNYGKRDMLIDDFLYENQDAVVIFAAGNEGHMAIDGTVATTSKNAIIVGASQTSNQGFIDSIQYINIEEESESCGVTVDTCCSDYSCSYTCCPSKIESQLKYLKASFNQNNIAYFSARGPATGNRMKPDCVAVGDRIVSARSDGSLTTNQCGNGYPNSTNDVALKINSGTSMSTPIVSGSVALIREYLRKFKGLSNPSGPLIKAVLINSCTSLNGIVSLDGSDSYKVALANKETPNKYEGFGAVGLSNVLEFNDSSFILELFDNQDISASVQCYSITSTDSNSFLKTTLAWYDAPNQANTIPSLISDLDLLVSVFDDGKIAQKVFGNGLNDKDSQNNVEKVTITGFTKDSIVMVKVSAVGLAQKQKYGLVLTRSKNMKKEDPSICQVLDAASNSVTLMEVAVLLCIGLVGFCLLSVVVFGVCICCCVLRKTSMSMVTRVNPVTKPESV